MGKRLYNTRKQYHFIYKTTNKLNGKYYFGMHSTDSLTDGYLGSGVYLRNSIRKHGRNNHTMEIIEFCGSREELAAREREVINLQLIAKQDCMNLRVGGKGGGFSEEQGRRGRSAALKRSKELWETDPNFRKRRLETLERMREVMRQKRQRGEVKFNLSGYWTGKKHRPERIQKMRESRRGRGNSQYGTCWITDGTQNSKVVKNSPLPAGWRKGRVMLD